MGSYRYISRIKVKEQKFGNMCLWVGKGGWLL